MKLKGSFFEFFRNSEIYFKNISASSSLLDFWMLPVNNVVERLPIVGENVCRRYELKLDQIYQTISLKTLSDLTNTH